MSGLGFRVSRVYRDNGNNTATTIFWGHYVGIMEIKMETAILQGYHKGLLL